MGPARTVLVLAFVVTAHAGADLLAQASKAPVLHMESGRSLEGIPVAVGRSSVTWRLPGSSSSGMTIPNSDISHIDFVPLAEWEKAMATFRKEEFAEAAELLERFIERNPREAFFPAPGNLISRSQRALLACYRRLGEEKKLAGVVARLDSRLLPPEERKLPPMLEAWTAVARRDWENAYAACQRALEGITDPSILAEIAYLKATAARKLGKFREALDEYVRASSLLIGYDAVIGGRSLRATAEILSGMDVPELRLRAVLAEYAQVYGGGQLWPDAPPPLRQRLIGPEGDPAAGQGEGGAAGGEAPSSAKKKKDWLEGF